MKMLPVAFKDFSSLKLLKPKKFTMEVVLDRIRWLSSAIPTRDMEAEAEAYREFEVRPGNRTRPWFKTKGK